MGKVPKSLYDITAELEWMIQEAVDQETGEVNPELVQRLDALSLAFEEKALSVAAYVLSLDAYANGIGTEIKRLKRKKEMVENLSKRLREYVARCVPMGQKLEDHRVTIGWRRSKFVDVFDPDGLPKSYLREKISIEPDKTLIKKAIESGEDVPGATLVEKQNLQLR
jgi:hypothetical protein